MKYADTYEEFQRVKAVFNTRNPVGDMLFKLSEQMVASGMLEKNDETQYRWKGSFAGYWYPQ